MSATETWLIEDPNAGAPIEEMEVWLFQADIDIENAESAGHRDALEAARQRVLGHLRLRRGGAMRSRQDLDQPGAVKTD